MEKEDEAKPVPFYATPGSKFEVAVEHLSGAEHPNGKEYSVRFHTYAGSGESFGPLIHESRLKYKGESAEYVTESGVSSEGTILPLADFGTWEVAEAWAQGNHTYGPWDFASGRQTLVGVAEKSGEPEEVLAGVSALSPQESHREFYVNWHRHNQKNTCTPESPPPPAPTATTGEPTGNPSQTGASLEGTVNPNGGYTGYYFEYGATTSYGNSTVEAGAGSGEAPVAAAGSATGLTPDTVYHYRLVAGNAGGLSFGKDHTFKTRGWTPPQATITPEGAKSVTLDGVSCSARNACTAVGWYTNKDSTNVSLAERWNGTVWEVQSTPNPAESKGSFLEAVSCHGAAECTAVGSYEKTGDGPHYPFAERWNGSTWAIETMPLPTEGEYINLAAVSCASSKQCVAVGSYKTGTPPTRQALAEEWTGTAWKVKITAKLGAEDEQASFGGVSCAAASKCVVVGVQLGKTFGERALAESLDGTKWSTEAVASPEHSLELELNGVSCSATSACTAVGRYKDTEVPSGEHCCEHHGEEALIERWNGSAWALQTAPSPLGKSKDENQEHWVLSQVSCGTATTCSAVGLYAADSAGKEVVLLGEYWNGTTWELEPPVNRSGVALNELLGLSCSEAELCTAVGQSSISLPSGPRESLAEQLEPAEA